jgi:hypothetical protein
VAARKENAAPVAPLCGCGCGAAAKLGRSFVQGHDARFHGILARALREGATSVEINGASVDIAAEYAKRGWVPAKARASRKLTVEERIAKLQAQLAELQAS